jgi:uncharacterized membrane protein YobD (UPF0266 family)
MAQSSDHPSIPLTCRIQNGMLILPVLFGLVGLMCFLPFLADQYSLRPKQKGDDPILLLVFCTLGLSILAGSLMGVWCIFRAFITASDEGIHWRTVGREKFARWSEVTDYYEIGQKSQVAPVFVTTQGKRSFSKNVWTNSEEMAQTIQQRATNAKSDRWLKFGLRPCDPWPHIFRYLNNSTKLQIAGCLLCQILLLGLFFSEPGQASRLTSLPRPSGPDGEIGIAFWAISLVSVILYLLYLLLPAIIGICLWRASSHRSDHEITASQEGLTYRDKQRTISVRWENVTDFYILQKSRSLFPYYIVETTQGNFDFTRILEYSSLPLSMVIAHKTNHPEWPHRDRLPSDLIGSDTPHAPTPYLKNGIMTFHFRNRTARAVFILFTFVMALTGIMPFFNSEGPSLGKVLFCIAMVLTIGYIWRFYKMAELRLEERGIYYSSVFRTSHLPWSDVKSVEPVDQFILIYRLTTKKPMWLWGGISFSNELIEEIRHRAPSP